MELSLRAVAYYALCPWVPSPASKANKQATSKRTRFANERRISREARDVLVAEAVGEGRV